MKCWNVLMVDDEPMVLRVHGKMVSKLGHIATMYNSPLEALEYARRRSDQIDLVITDYHMPGLSGLDFIRQLKSVCEHVPILMLTGYANEIDLKKVAEFGAEVLEKPVRMEVLSSYLEELQERYADDGAAKPLTV